MDKMQNHVVDEVSTISTSKFLNYFFVLLLLSLLLFSQFFFENSGINGSNQLQSVISEFTHNTTFSLPVNTILHPENIYSITSNYQCHVGV